MNSRQAPVRDWRAHWRGISETTPATVEDALRQVGKTVLGEPVALSHVDTILDTITAQLELVPSDVVVDLGCGNGLLTVGVADRVDRIIGVDVSETLISAARALNGRPNCTYCVGDLAALDESLFAGTTKAYSYEVLQHLSTDETARLLDSLSGRFAEGLMLFVGSLPDRSLRRAFYDTPDRWDRYQQNLASGTEQIGHWWERQELVELCRSRGLDCRTMDQSDSLYTSHYRFDARILRR